LELHFAPWAFHPTANLTDGRAAKRAANPPALAGRSFGPQALSARNTMTSSGVTEIFRESDERMYPMVDSPFPATWRSCGFVGYTGKGLEFVFRP
jgi:hypothetical protein